MSSQVYLRVNGIQIDNLKIRPKMVSGAPIGEKELVIEDPLLGKFAIDDSFILETTTDRRRKWEITSVKNFLAMLDIVEA
jgi:hypothetical protein